MILGNFSAWNIQNVLIRVIAAVILGGIIGLDRGMKHRGAGTKTITVVCLGATLVMLTEQYIQIYYPGLANMNRMANNPGLTHIHRIYHDSRILQVPYNGMQILTFLKVDEHVAIMRMSGCKTLYLQKEPL